MAKEVPSWQSLLHMTIVIYHKSKPCCWNQSIQFVNFFCGHKNNSTLLEQTTYGWSRDTETKSFSHPEPHKEVAVEWHGMCWSCLCRIGRNGCSGRLNQKSGCCVVFWSRSDTCSVWTCPAVNNVSGFVSCSRGEIVNVPVILVVVHSNDELRLCIVWEFLCSKSVAAKKFVL